jgi:hypothetical protein
MMEFVNGKDDIPYMKWKTIQMFETTNQIRILESYSKIRMDPVYSWLS